ncbi:unnamed protein product [Eruca vesicaria subsp. sativa]|uniref:Replication factor A C-terminal domain-containing protein n=1 Tax=Eruca vesicaria subsp. sativa TaxID=29727 RepID=A0ABC8LPT9_ERUVS|nr:unnamed protein product [Eruca vesicaria subsp. sativa]
MTSGSEATETSVPVKNVGESGVSSGQSVSTKAEDPPAAKSKATKPTQKGGSSSGVNLGGGRNMAGARKEAFSAAAKGKSIVSGDVGKENVIQGFIPQGRSATYLPLLKSGATYRLTRFFGSQSKTIYRVADPTVTISLSWNSVLSEFKDSSVCFPEDRFRFHDHKEFAAAADKRGVLSLSSTTASRVAWFECIATIDDVVHGAEWYYIGCRQCHTKAIKGPTTLMCKKCGKHEIDAVPQYHSKLSVYDHKDQAVFVLLGHAGEELTGKKAAELVDSYYKVNNIEEEAHIVPVPQALLSTIGQTRKFVVKVSTYNLTGKAQSLTVTKVLPFEEEEHEVNIAAQAGEAPENGTEDQAEESVKRGADVIEGEEPKRSKLG